jgi:hypothetical protein
MTCKPYSVGSRSAESVADARTIRVARSLTELQYSGLAFGPLKTDAGNAGANLRELMLRMSQPAGVLQ